MEGYGTLLKLKIDKLATQNEVKLKSLHIKPPYDSTMDPKFKLLFNQNEHKMKFTVIRMHQITEESKILLEKIHETKRRFSHSKTKYNNRSK